MNVYDILSQDAFWQVNKKIAKASSIEASVLLADLVSKERYFKERGELTEDGFFFNSQKQIENDTTLTAKVQNSRLKQLEKHGLIEISLRKIPATKHYKIKHENIIKLLVSSNEYDRLAEKDILDCPEGSNYFAPKEETTLAEKDILDSTKGITNKKQSNKKQSSKKQTTSIEDISSNEETSSSEKNLLTLEHQEEGKEKKVPPKKEKQLSTVVIEVYYEWFKNMNDGIQPKIDGVEGKASKSLASYFKAMQTKEGIIYQSDFDKVRDLFSYILSKWDKLEPFLQKQVKLSQISSNITNIINNLKNGKQTSNQQQSRSINNQESFGSAFDAIDQGWNNP